ncbi:hypothetical protein ScPMuIL_007036 [Solemya velum]
MCIGLWSCFVDFFVYVLIVTLPVFGSFCGTEIILKLSIIIYIYVVLGELIPKILQPILSYVHVVILALLVGYLPLYFIPYPVIWVYDKLIWLSEPVFLLSEVILFQNFVFRKSQKAADAIANGDDSELVKWKTVVTVFSVLCYGGSLYYGWLLYTEASTAQLWLLFLVVLLLLAVHNMMWMSMEGIISDAAFCSLLSVCIMYSMYQETDLIQKPNKLPESWFRHDRKKALFSLILSILNTNIANAYLALEFLKKFLRPFFLVSFSMRLYGILCIIGKATKIWGKTDEEETWVIDENDVQSTFSPWKSSLTVKLAVIFLFTQVTVNLFHESSGVYSSDTLLSKLLQSIWPRQILIGRIAQILTVNAFYVWRLYCAEDWTWSEWFN